MAEVKDEFLAKRAKRKKKQRKRRLIIFFAFFLIVAAVVGAALSLTCLFPIKEINAAGSKIYTPQQIVDGCGLKKGDNLFVFSEDDVTSALRKKLPYADNVKIKRILPDTVEIIISDAAEYLCVSTGAEYYVLSKKNIVLDKRETKPDGLPAIILPDGASGNPGEEMKFTDAANGQVVCDLPESFVKSGITVDSVDLSNNAAVIAKVESRFTVNFGSLNDLDMKIAHLSSMIKSIAADKTGSVNLSMWTPDNHEGSFIEGSFTP